MMIILACVIFDVALHRLSAWMFDFNYFNNGLPQSVLVKNGTFPIAALLGFSAMFGFLALNYYRSRSEIGGTPLGAAAFLRPVCLHHVLRRIRVRHCVPLPSRPRSLRPLRMLFPISSSVSC